MSIGKEEGMFVQILNEMCNENSKASEERWKTEWKMFKAKYKIEQVAGKYSRYLGIETVKTESCYKELGKILRNQEQGTSLNNKICEHMRMLCAEKDKKIADFNAAVECTADVQKEIIEFHTLLYEYLFEKMRQYSVERISKLLDATNMTKPRRKEKTVGKFSRETLEILERSYEDFLYPAHETKERLALKTGLSVKRVSSWFSNKRSRNKEEKEGREYSDFITKKQKTNSLK
eukprot:Nk52_evm1s115 gene=Nk52_evmTU1s115